MRTGVLKYIALWFFILGVSLIVLIQFITSQNVKHLGLGNKRLLKEVAVQKKLRDLVSDMLTVESDIRGAVITNDSTRFITGVDAEITDIESELADLNNSFEDSSYSRERRALDNYVQRKMQHSRNILNAYRRSGTEAGQSVINTGQGKLFRDSIVAIVGRLDTARERRTTEITSAIERNSERARTFGLGLAIIACFACILAFFYVVNKGHHQERMIQMLNESEKRIKEGAFIKEQFLANMSHEIRTPMNAILGFTNLLRRSPLNSQQQQYVDYIYSSSQNLLTLINDILDLSKIEAGMMHIEAAPFSLNGLISSVQVMFQDKAAQKNLKFHIEIDSTIHDTLSGDPVRLTQILINLLSNAIKFTERGEVSFEVKSLEQSVDKVLLVFRVKDTGVGIAKDKIEAVFGRFQQAEAETTRRFGGTGLGLAIVKQLVDLQGGTIKLESEAGKGSEFTIILAFKPVYDYEHDISLVREAVHTPIHGLRVLVAEDNQMNQHLIRHLMKQWQMDFKLVNNGNEAVEALRNESFSAVLMDIQMPELDGYDATQLIRRELKLDIPIIAMTAHAMIGEKERCLSFGMNDYISKPIKEGELYSILQNYHPGAGVKAEPSNQVINLDYLKELSQGDTEFENAIVRQFIVQVPEEIALLQEAVSIENRQQIKSIAHGMKSSVAYLGLTEQLTPLLHRMEVEAVSNINPHHFAEDLQEIKRVCEQAVVEARTILNITT